MTERPSSVAATDEVGWLAEARAGDATAFERLYRANVGRVYALCLRMTGDEQQAEEATQDTFVRAWRKLDSFRGDSAFATWLHRLAVNEVRQRWRRDGRRRARVETTDDLSGLDRGRSDGRPEARVALERAIRTLPDGARTVFVLYDVEGYKHREIAEMTGTAVGTVKSQLHRARRLLREALEA